MVTTAATTDTTPSHNSLMMQADPAMSVDSTEPADSPGSLPTVRLVLALHNHQPVGNFDGVIAEAVRDSYQPFLDVLEDFPDLAVVIHTSGSLLEWLVANDPGYVERLRSFVERGQVEVLGGPFFEPVLASIPRRDRVGQIRAYSDFLERTLGVRPRGMWVPERVWEHGYTGDVTAAGIEYTLLDDLHFRGAGLADDDLTGPYLSEDEDRLLRIVPIQERLRYIVPFHPVDEVIEWLWKFGEQHPGGIATFGDDGEKFGVWPGTQKHVFEDGWLRTFFERLTNETHWLKTVTLSEAVDAQPPRGRISLPDASYREMMEWALPPDRNLQLRRLQREHEQFDETWPDLKQYVRGGTWRGFLAKYREAADMQARMKEVSRLIDGTADVSDEARTHLYRGQCNCPYWHGSFGGLYLPFLRQAIYKELIAAERAVRPNRGEVVIDAADFNLDARPEVRLASERLVAFLSPATGGHLYELDVRDIGVNLLATLDRRFEPYHQELQQQLRGELPENAQPVDVKADDLVEKLRYDTWPRRALVDHFLADDCDLAAFRRGEGHIGDFATGEYTARLRMHDDRSSAVLSRTGRVGEHDVTLTKTLTLEAARPGELVVQYDLENLPRDRTLRLGIEWNIAGLAPGADDRYLYAGREGDIGAGEKLGPIETVVDTAATDAGDVQRVGLVDEWLGLDVSLDLSTPATLWTHPIETVSSSEGGLELVYQSTSVVPVFAVTADDDGRWSVTLRLHCDTSAAQARQLAAMSS